MRSDEKFDAYEMVLMIFYGDTCDQPVFREVNQKMVKMISVFFALRDGENSRLIRFLSFDELKVLSSE